MPVGALAVSNLLIWTFAEFIFSLSVLTVEWKSRQMCEFFASGGWEENDILLDNLQLLCFSRSFYSSERGVPGCRGGTVLSSPAWKSFFGGEKSRVFLGSQACARGLLNMCRAGQKGGFPGGCVFFVCAGRVCTDCSWMSGGSEGGGCFMVKVAAPCPEG